MRRNQVIIFTFVVASVEVGIAILGNIVSSYIALPLPVAVIMLVVLVIAGTVLVVINERQMALPAANAPVFLTQLTPAIVTRERLTSAESELRQTSSPSEPQGRPFDDGLLPAAQHFVGRESEVSWLMVRLNRGYVSAITALRGLGGIGKTTLAAEAVRRLRAAGRFPDGIAVVLCEGQHDALAILRAVLARFDPQRRPPAATDLSGLAESAHRLL